MTSKACTPDNVMGKLTAMLEASGKDVDVDFINELDNGGKASYVNSSTKHKAEVFESSESTPQHQSDTEAVSKLSWLTGDAPQVARGVCFDVRNPSGVFGEDVIAPVVEFITDHHETFHGNLDSGRSAYFQGIKEVFDGIDTSHMDENLQGAFDRYRNYYATDGGELYNLNKRSGAEKAVSNLGGNVIKSSPNVIIGNVLEGVIKLPTLYGKTCLQALAETVGNGGFIKKLPELEAKGIYGVNYAGETLGKWEGLIGLTDVPLKNLAYTAGRLQGGDTEALRAVQRVAFTPRFGDLPPIYYSGGGRMLTQFLSYTINSYKMYAGLWSGLKNAETRAASLQGLVTYHALAGLIGGGTAAVPSMLQQAIVTAYPDAQEWFDENQNALTQLIQPGNINRLAIGADIASRQIQRTEKNIGSASEKAYSGDSLGSVLDLADAGLSAMAFTNAPVGDLNLQKVLRVAKDIALDEIDLDEVPEKLQETYFPSFGG